MCDFRDGGFWTATRDGWLEQIYPRTKRTYIREGVSKRALIAIANNKNTTYGQITKAFVLWRSKKGGLGGSYNGL